MEWYEIVVCIILGILTLTGLTIWYAVSKAKSWLLDDVETLDKRFDTYKLEYPEATDIELIRKVIHRESIVAGILGFITGVGGVAAMPITLPLDVISSVRIQSRLTKFIQDKLGNTSDTKNMAIAVTTNQVSTITAGYVLKLTLQFVPKIAGKAIPIVGGIIGALVDASSTKALGEVLLMKKELK
jgi:uncharacterized protein (DUF697 family)